MTTPRSSTGKWRAASFCFSEWTWIVLVSAISAANERARKANATSVRIANRRLARRRFIGEGREDTPAVRRVANLLSRKTCGVRYGPRITRSGGRQGRARLLESPRTESEADCSV